MGPLRGRALLCKVALHAVGRVADTMAAGAANSMSDDMTTRMPETVRLRALMASYQSGHLAAFDELYALAAPMVRRYLGSRLALAHRVDDLVQETFLQMHRARHTYDPAYPLEPWLLAIARHVWLMDRRTASRRVQPSVTIDAVEVPVRAASEALGDRVAVRSALRAMSPAQRAAVVWHHVWGFSFRDIAARLRIRESAAKLRSSRGMADLRRRLDVRAKKGAVSDE
jgi:RNA polymerase sigma factor (sigma-70 family)